MSERRQFLPLPREILGDNAVWVVLYVLGVVVAFVLSFLARHYPYFPGDIAISHLVQSIDSRPFAALMWGVSEIGTTPLGLAIALVCALALLLTNRRLEGIFTFLTLSGDVLTVLIKSLVHRPRPGPDLVNVIWGDAENGFPSGHAVHFVVFYGFLFFLAQTQMRPSRLRTAVLVVLGLLIALVGISRVYLGAHWPSDVIAGYLIGALWLVVLIRVYTLVKQRRSSLST
ncbi:MAG: phosphatase PAP2 family protein [Chloroflexi bacterium]|nr:phosphatase PAP2 family protein [Chloroflexota bacterium]